MNNNIYCKIDFIHYSAVLESRYPSLIPSSLGPAQYQVYLNHLWDISHAEAKSEMRASNNKWRDD